MTKREFDVATWRSWKVLLGVQSTAYAAFGLGVPEVVEGGCDLMDSLCKSEGVTFPWRRRDGSIQRRVWGIDELNNFLRELEQAELLQVVCN